MLISHSSIPTAQVGASLPAPIMAPMPGRLPRTAPAGRGERESESERMGLNKKRTTVHPTNGPSPFFSPGGGGGVSQRRRSGEFMNFARYARLQLAVVHSLDSHMSNLSCLDMSNTHQAPTQALFKHRSKH